MPYKGIYLIGLTGGIACGKSTVLRMLAERGAHVIDADRVTHELQRPGEEVYDRIVAAFGPEILTQPGGPIDRRRLGAVVFADPDALRHLEQIVHPAVHAHILAWLDEIAHRVADEHVERSTSNVQRAPVAVIDAVKLLEAGWKPLCDAIWVVTCAPEQQLQRLVATRGLSEEEARARIAAQPPQERRTALADVVIDNSGPLDATRAQVDRAWHAIQLQR
ncbi:MAG TPA: dephospho-CoA kinase [Roseiflexaceae bacterium]|nr:dephospho-CoA kinase [Roseiflexaceae bacterium]